MFRGDHYAEREGYFDTPAGAPRLYKNRRLGIGVRVQGSGGGGARVQITGHRVQFRARQKRLTSYGVPVALLLPMLLIRINASSNTATVPSASVSP